MKRTTILFLLLSVNLILLACSNQKKKVLIFSKTVEFRHDSIEEGIVSIQGFLESKNIQIDATEDASYFTEDSLKQYSTIIFLNTTGNVLNSKQQADFERYIQAGGGFVGIHAATDTEYNWPWYNELVGAYFDGHPAVQDANLKCVSKEDDCCNGIPEIWSLNEEWYNFKSINPNVQVLMEVDESSYQGGTNGDRHPVVWKHVYDGGRSFYTALGHQVETFQDSIFLQQLWKGIEFCIGKKELNYANARTLRVPEENRFNKKVLDFNLDEPMELDELGNRGIIYIERRGAIKLFNYENEKVELLDTLNVHYANEDGLLGLAVDPKYDENNWIYLFYSPNTIEPKQNISRFTLKGNKLTEEKILLEIPLLRECCHSGGSLEFGKDGLLYIGVGDNTNPFESSGYAPIDERLGRQLFDAQRSAANTNDLRGKILRIKPMPDGTYSIPEGNLFPKDMEKCRPEIFVMGCRNPFRFSIDSKNNYLFWGDVGPDAGTYDSLRGPIGMGELNQAKRPGFYGWPYSRGNNQMYNDYNFKTEKSGIRFDSNKIINTSPNNTGIQELPPIQESMVWYSYKKSKKFPWLGVGGVNPMSGPIFHSENYSSLENSFPEYFENKWFVYEWMRDWIYVVHLNEQFEILQADPFLPNMEFSHPMDMLFSKDGKLYILEYGQKWNSRNLDARLSLITYNSGNRAPVAKFTSDKQVGATPLKVQFTAEKSIDYDGDDLSYDWNFGDQVFKTTNPEITYDFINEGIYDVELTVSDSDGESSTISKKIIAGNDMPVIKIKLSDENTTFTAHRTLKYEIEVDDFEDGNSVDGSLDTSKVKVSFTYIPEGQDIIQASIGHQQNVTPLGLSLINESGCKACHAIDKKVAGPSYKEVSIRYDKDNTENLIHRIIKGSQGIWGDHMMAPHPQLKLEEVEEMVKYILSLDPKEKVAEQLLPVKGILQFKEHLNDEVSGKYILMASYLDNGIPNIEGTSLSAVEEYIFISPRIELEDALSLEKDLGIWETQGRTVVGSITNDKTIKIAPIDFTHLNSISLGAVFGKDYHYYGQVELRKGHKNGQLIGSDVIEYYDKKKEAFKVFEVKTLDNIGRDTLVLVFKNSKDDEQFTMNGDWIQLNYNE